MRRRHRDTGKTQGSVVFASDLSRRDRGDAQGGCAGSAAATFLPDDRHRGLSGAPLRRRSLKDKTFSVVTGTTGETWLSGRLNDFQLTANVDPVASYDDGVMRVLDRSSDVFFGDRPILLEAAAESPSAADLTVLDKLFTYEPVALTLGRNDDDFRLVVDRALSRCFQVRRFPRCLCQMVRGAGRGRAGPSSDRARCPSDFALAPDGSAGPFGRRADVREDVLIVSA